MMSFLNKLAIATLLVLCTSCFDIKEIVKLNKDGTGTYKFTVDLSQSRAMFSMLQEFGSDGDSMEVNQKDPFQEIDKSFEESRVILEEIEGIANVQAIQDREALVFGMQFEFHTMFALNKALNRINNEQKDAIKKEQVFFRFAKKSFERFNTEDFSDDLLGSMNMGGEAADSLNMSMFFKDMSFSTEYTVPKKVKKMSNPDAELSSDKKTVIVKYYPFKGEGEMNLSNRIEF